MSFPYLSEDERVQFPPPSDADKYGILGTGGNLSPGMLLSAYEQGIFPWFSEDEPILWWSPDPRFVLFLNQLHVPKSLQKTMKKGLFSYSCDTAFLKVIHACSAAPRKDQQGTWITEDMISGYVALHELGYAHSFEVWREGELAGGLYGVSIGNCFFGESMFSNVPDASKAGFVTAAEYLGSIGIDMIDSQVRTEHVERFGARDIPRSMYLAELNKRKCQATRRGSWTDSFSRQLSPLHGL